jgi:hypothetical protein
MGYKRAGFICITPHHLNCRWNYFSREVIAMGTVFCCSSATPYRPRILDHEDKFQAFLRWIPSAKPSINEPGAIISHALYAVQVVKQVNYGPQESIRYFIATIDDARFVETSEDALISANFEKLNSY